ncbi:MAG: hypothetical protein WC242_05355 [Candidatus Paceibacterota bacterium]|jgi:hypothetical protein
MKTQDKNDQFLREFIYKVLFPSLIIETVLLVIILQFTGFSGKMITTIGFGLLLNLAAAMYITFDLAIYLLTKENYTNKTILGGTVVLVSPFLGLAIPVAISVFFARYFFKFKFRSFLKTL